MERFQIYLTREQIEFINRYGQDNGIIACTGRTTGKVDKSAVIRKALDTLQGIHDFDPNFPSMNMTDEEVEQAIKSVG